MNQQNAQQKIYLALVHHPISNKRGELVTTSVTNLDIHDIARSCKTFGIERYYLVTPLDAQWQVVGRILGHWSEAEASAYNPDRQEAISIAKLTRSVDDAVAEIAAECGQQPLLVGTSAQAGGEKVRSMPQVLQQAFLDKRPIFLLFGTGWGMHASLMERTDVLLEPINGRQADGYNHLSVRSAVAIYLDRLATTIRSL
jgi:hypothetical protein